MSLAVQRKAGRRLALRSGLGGVLAAAGAFAGLVQAAHAAPSLPEIRTSASNPVPRCVTPERLMAFLKRRNAKLIPRFRNIASYYKQHGEAWHVRWDYAFFQMAIETNFLTYRAPSGRMGDVDPKQNNFAGIGTTGGGVPGDSFPDVSTGVLGQIQHLVAYSGEEVANPVAPRTQLKQVHILEKSRELKRAVRFSDLSRRWAADPKYGSSIAWVAGQFAREECQGRQEAEAQEAETLPWLAPKVSSPQPAKQVAASGNKDAPGVRTVWRRDTAKTGASETAASGQPKTAAKLSAPKPVPTETIMPSATPAAALDSQAADSASPFALFSPPAALADAALARGGAPKYGTRPEGEAPPPAPARATEAPASGELKSGSVAMGPTAPSQDAMVAPLADAQRVAQAAPGTSNFAPPSGLGVKPGRCVVETATFGGDTTVLVKSPVGADVHYIALSVLDGFEAPMTESFLAARQGGGETIGTFPNKDEALAKARTLCPE